MGQPLVSVPGLKAALYCGPAPTCCETAHMLYHEPCRRPFGYMLHELLALAACSEVDLLCSNILTGHQVAASHVACLALFKL